MNAQQLANAIIEILPKVNIPFSAENIAAGGQLYDTLGKMLRGELILAVQGSCQHEACHHVADCHCYETED